MIHQIQNFFVYVYNWVSSGEKKLMPRISVKPEWFLAPIHTDHVR